MDRLVLSGWSAHDSSAKETDLQLDALGDPTRRAVFERLLDGPRRVGELAREFPVSRPAVSQHLRVLKEAGLVIDRRDGRGRLYQLNPDGISRLRSHFDDFWNRALDMTGVVRGTP